MSVEPTIIGNLSNLQPTQAPSVIPPTYAFYTKVDITLQQYHPISSMATVGSMPLPISQLATLSAGIVPPFPGREAYTTAILVL